MGNIIKLTNGSQVVVRTGILAGVGPQGPRGLIGPAGPAGDQGPTGQVGPMGSITQYASRFVASTQSVSCVTESNLAFNSATFDQIGAQQSTTNYKMPVLGDYILTAHLMITDYGTQGRYIFYIKSSINGRVAVAELRAGTGQNNALVTGVNLHASVRADVTETFNVSVVGDSNDNVITLSANSYLEIVRVGPGPQGIQGPTGPEGPVGPQGIKGDTGPAGNAGSGYTTYGGIIGS